MMGMGARAVRVLVYRAPVDMRKQHDGLAALVTGELRGDLLSGDVYVFVGKTRKRAKALTWDGTGLCLYSKKLVQGKFAAPWAAVGDGGNGGELTLTGSELLLFFEGSTLVFRRALSPPPYDPSGDALVFA
ncbi:transposase [bacterium]|nr:MAG: transposase [bacterium]